VKRSNDLIDVAEALPTINEAVEEETGVSTVPVPDALISSLFSSFFCV